jgi:hypothetical protein
VQNVLDLRSRSARAVDSDWPLENQLSGLVSWLEFGDVEDQLRFVRPIVFRHQLKRSMLPFYALLAESHGYRLRASRSSRSTACAYFLRDRHSTVTAPAAA